MPDEVLPLTTDDLVMEIGRLNVILMGERRRAQKLQEELNKLKPLAAKAEQLDASVKSYAQRLEEMSQALFAERQKNTDLQNENAELKRRIESYGKHDTVPARPKRVSPRAQ